MEETKILVWNLQRFSLNKLLHAESPRYDAEKNWQKNLTCTLNDAYLYFTVTTMDPDIFVVIEVQSSQGCYGTPVDGVGASGLIKVLTDIRRHNANWCLVPALRLNSDVDLRRGGVLSPPYTEGVGVFYRSDRLSFEGPWMWPNAAIDNVRRAVAANTPSVVASAYPSIWQNCLPQGNFFAGQYLFTEDDGSPVDFTEWWHRQPWFTQFREIGRQVNRTINLTSVHLDPKNKVAAKNSLRLIRECVPGYWDIPDNTVSIIAGDFNLNRNNPKVEKNLLDATRTDERDWVFKPAESSLYTPIAEATAANYRRTELLDNAIVLYPDALADTPRQGIVADIALGQAAGNGMPAVPKTMYRAPQDFQAYFEAESLPQVEIDNRFRAAINFGHIGPSAGLSDHLPIYFKV